MSGMRGPTGWLMGATMICALAAPAISQQIPAPYGQAVTLDQARKIVDAARGEAQRRKKTMVFAVMNPSGHLILLEAMDGTQYGSIGVAQEKARSAALFRRSTKAFSDAVASGALGPLTLDDVVAVEGGVPIVSAEKVIGALGVSGGTSQEDGQIAAFALTQAETR